MTAGYFDSSAIVKLYANELHHELVRRFEGVLMAPDESIESEAARLASVDAVRGFDAVHLATAKAVRVAVPGMILFVCFDKRLDHAAASEQFQLLPAA